VGDVCVKRALPRLRVAQVWEAPVERNRYERLWLEAAGAAAPGAAPRVLAFDDKAGLFAMEYVPFPVWKERLRQGEASPAFAAQVGARLAAIHRATAGRADVAERFATDEIFHAIRLEPYLEATARAYPDLAPALTALVEITARTRRALVHGDVSPKNILVGPEGPVFLDAECAWYGDPAFDLAFCLNHLLLKCVWRPESAAGYLEGFEALARAYRAGVAWEDPGAAEARAARLLPGLLLARIDGKSPVEYITAESDKNMVRKTARWLLASPVDTLPAVAAAWSTGLAAAR
jgi:5-methylthioribose kinase